METALECTILTPAGAVVGRGVVAPRADGHVAEAYAVQIWEVDPPGALEALVYAGRPEVIVRPKGEVELYLRIDHITGPPPQRAFFCVAP